MGKKRYSLVVAMYNVEAYVSAFLDSLLAQSTPVEMLDVIIVDDGSSDSSVQIVRKWNKNNGNILQIISKENGGPASARNIGLDLAVGDWVTFCDPDDVLHSDYFAEIENFLRSDKQQLAQMLTSRLVQHEDGTIRVNHKHPLDWKFRHGNRLVDLTEKPNHVQLSGGTVFLKLDVIRTNNLRFDERIRPKFEDANLIGRYLAVVDEPIVGIVAKARYFYRKRADGSSLVQGAWGDPRAYDEVPNLGYLGMMEFVLERLGSTPSWAQYMVLYDLVWMYVADKSMHSKLGSITADQQRTMLDALDQILSRMDRESICNFSAVGMGWTFYNMLLQHYKTPLEPTPVIIDWGMDKARGLRKMSYMFVGSVPSEEIYLGTAACAPYTGKVISHSLLGRVLVRERSFTIPEGPIQVFLDGRRARITRRTDLPDRKHAVLSDNPRLKLSINQRKQPAALTRFQGLRAPFDKFGQAASENSTIIARGLRKVRLQAQLSGVSRSRAATGAGMRILNRRLELGPIGMQIRQKEADKAVVLSSLVDNVQAKYRNAWVLLDRKDRADDNAEHLYRYLSRSESENVWFLLERSSPDWQRLKSDGFKLVEYGSDESVRLVLNASYVISSHADRDIQYPIDQQRFGKSNAKIVFLQHGVTKDDLSRWINGKSLSLMITASVDEHESIVGNDNPYKWGSSTVKLTGFPRHDNLIRMAGLTKHENRTTVLIAPTCRQYVTDVMKQHSSLQDKVGHFKTTEFGSNWLEVLNDSRLEALSSSSNMEIAFLGHPNLAEIVGHLNLPPHIKVLSYEGLSVQETLVKSSVVVSDYSSLAFDGAIGGASVIHFQFDGSEIFNGGHVYRKGYFDYESQGFGAVAVNASEVVDEIMRIHDNGFVRDEKYTERVERTFPIRDGKSCVRVARAIKNLDRPWNDQLQISGL